MLSGRPKTTLLLGDETEAIAKLRNLPSAQFLQTQI